jgi:ribosome-binding protein aMBF1 (putative translation factor)
VPKGGWVLHHCDIPPCVNPIHLFLGDAKINAEDRERKGRGQKQKGASSHRAKLTWEQVVEIRTTYDKKAGITQKVLAERFGVSDQQISRILSGKNYQVPE